MNKPKTLKDKKYPSFIRDNAVIKKVDTVTKSFAEIRLPDSSTKYTHKCSSTIEKFVPLLKTGLNQLPDIWYKYISDGSSLRLLMSEFDKLFRNITVSSIKKGIRLVLPCEVRYPSYYSCKIIVLPKGSSLIGLLNYLCQDLKEAIYDVKIENKYNNLINRAVDLELSWNKRLKIVFSTHPWDIATMSMRGISSCQSWGKQQSSCLIGSIIDPNMGIMYLSDGVAHKTYGERMLARSVVRLVMPNKKIDKTGYVNVSEVEKNKRGFLLEPAYAHVTPGPSQSRVYNNIFRKTLNKISSKRLISGKLLEKYNFGIPLTPQVQKTPEQFRSYRDSGIMYVPMIN